MCSLWPLSVPRYHDCKGINLGDVDVLVDVKELQGEQFVHDRKSSKGDVVLVKRFAQDSSVYAFQTVVKVCTCVFVCVWGGGHAFVPACVCTYIHMHVLGK